ncbi:MAG: 2-dehydropantoate 2-reductase [Acidobacteria bacterium]|nr:MAG: 2-dehydropantoate 2-reductase [Acidobacteriota bacterium]PYY05258.1 MAG: 2-dehydropantoate 2-reductase [Acidobacteriota bacterium]
MQHAILGAGGVGGLIGASLAHSGEQVTLVVKGQALGRYPNQLHLESAFGKFDAPVRVGSEVPAADVLWITVKATQLEPALASLPDGRQVRAILPLLNGIDHVSFLRSRYGVERVIPATISVESERVSPGHIVHRSPFAKLSVASSGRKLLEGTLDQLQKIGFTCQFVDHEPTLMWTKLVFLAPLALASSAAGKTIGEMRADLSWQQRLESCVREVCSVAIAEGAKLDAEAVIATIRGLPGPMRSSMQKDVEQGRPPELDAIGGPILRAAERHHLEVPITRKLVEAVERKIR